MNDALGKALYGALFTLVWPAALALWSWSLDRSGFITWPVPLPTEGGVTLLVLGCALMGAGMLSLWRDGGGLPMNAYPTTRFVTRSVYAAFAHPIYVGFTLGVAGAAALLGSPAGFWLAAPLSGLASAALVLGYEGPKLRERFGPRAAAPLLGLPLGTEACVPLHRRAIVGLVALGPWAALYALFSTAPEPTGAVELSTDLEGGSPRPAAMVWVYSAAYLYAALAPLALPSGAVLRRFGVAAWIATALGFSTMLLLPGRSTFSPGEYDALTAWLMAANRSLDADWLACPSFHVAWTALASAAYATRLPAWRPLFVIATALVGASCVLTGAHALVDVAAGLLLAWLAWRHGAVWRGMVLASERLGNSLTSVRLGPVRILSHALWSGLGAAGGTLVVLVLAGPQEGAAALGIVVVGVVGAGAWGYALEGGDRLARPFGYFGFLLAAGAAVLALAAWDPARGGVLAAAFAAAAPLAQGVGRARCLVQGCCHGRPAIRSPGMRVSHPGSRVVQLSRFACVPIHPTPLYSALANAALLALLLRLWWLGAPWTLVAGGYLALSSLARFVEEEFRGEPQTGRFADLTVYQWLAVGGFFAGLALSALPGAPVDAAMQAPASAWLLSLGAGLLVAGAMSADLPGSRLPLSRLTVMAPGEAVLAPQEEAPGAVSEAKPSAG